MTKQDLSQVFQAGSTFENRLMSSITSTGKKIKNRKGFGKIQYLFKIGTLNRLEQKRSSST